MNQFTNNSHFNMPMVQIDTEPRVNPIQQTLAQEAQQRLANIEFSKNQMNEAYSQGINWGTVSQNSELNKVHMSLEESAHEKRERNLREATERRRLQLEGESKEDIYENLKDRVLGKSEEEIQENKDKRMAIRTMTDEERVDNYLRNKGGDPNSIEDLEVSNLINTGSQEEILFKFKDYPKVLQLINQERNRTMQGISRASAYDDTHSANSVLAWGNLKAGVASGLAETVGAVSGAWHMATKSGEERRKAITDEFSLKNQISDWANAQKNSAGKVSDIQSFWVQKPSFDYVIQVLTSRICQRSSA